MEKVTVFLPCRKGSERVKSKNTKRFDDVEGGLIEIKIKQLLEMSSMEKLIISTDDEKVQEISYEILRNTSINYRILERPKHLASSSASTDDVIKHVTELPVTEHIMWTHVTSPFITGDIYDKAVQTYFKNISIYDSLMSVTPIYKYLWNEKETINYNRNIEKWPKTQTLDPIFEINSGIFIASYEVYRQEEDRIGTRPYMFEMDEETSFDIDWEHDFLVAESIWKKNRTKV